MRIIAAVTLIFLPGTFVATVFSTGLFDWGSGDPTPAGDDGGADGGGKIMSKYLWVYFMLTGALTAVVLVAWGLFSWVQKRRMVRQFGLDLEEGDTWESETNTGRSAGGQRRDTEATLVDDRTHESTLQSWRREMLLRWMSFRTKQRNLEIKERETKIV